MYSTSVRGLILTSNCARLQLILAKENRKAITTPKVLTDGYTKRMTNLLRIKNANKNWGSIVTAEPVNRAVSKSVVSYDKHLVNKL